MPKDIPAHAVVIYRLSNVSKITTCYEWFDSRESVPCQSLKRRIITTNK